ncbi:acyltransferase family protein [Catenuloplanes atrovinosus]|uniref:Peptidoglycan/LPS O-acetylase OafA/YrhL n=1 Tax=Catenuloplanes atrovinosus TaxID=137266 RepID=A0AAE4CAV6_9ACTN|nr:acyltransferase [Catenuloplanes atrovinosus]MDR7276239.1 peptidoglycan/LPS O-acetylase OafA/YrhL [Catenuloplanes atrovinosus]
MADGVLVRSIEAATPPGRDRAVDGLRAVAILGVVLGHWLVTAMVVTGDGVGLASPLAHLGGLVAVSWLLQTLAVFFLVGGRVAALGHRGRDVPYRAWLAGRLARLLRPVPVLLAVWAAGTVGLVLAGAGETTVRTVLTLVLSPLWFLLVFAGLTALTPLAVRLHPAWPLLTVLVVDVIRFGFDGPAALGWINLAAGWLVPFTLGARFPSRRYGWVLLVGGAAATVALVRWAGYPASMVGVPGELSNLNPPTLAAVTFGLAQCGAALLLHGPLDRLLRRSARAWAAVALLNLSAMTVFLWHQTAMIAVTGLVLLTAGPLPGLHTAPETPAWAAARLMWLPLFAAALGVCWALFRRAESRPGALTGTKGRPAAIRRRPWSPVPWRTPARPPARSGGP